MELVECDSVVAVNTRVYYLQPIRKPKLRAQRPVSEAH